MLIFDEVITGFRHALGGYQSIAGVTPDLTTMGKAMGNGWPVSALGGKAELMELFSTTPGRPAFFAGTFNGHPPTAAAALATIDKLAARAGARARLRARRARAHGADGAVRAARRAGRRQRLRLGLRHVLPRRAGRRATTTCSRTTSTLFTGYRRELMKHGIFELPLNLKRSHFSYAHTDDDVDRLLEATEAAVTTVLGRRAMSALAVDCTIDLAAPGRQVGRCRSRSREHRRLGVDSASRSLTIANGDGPTVLVLGGNHGDEYEGQVAGAAARSASSSRSRSPAA